MDEKVFVSVKGLHFATIITGADGPEETEDEEVIETVDVGRYKRVGEVDYIKYTDMIDGQEQACNNIIKIYPDGKVEITKKGYVTMHLSFIPKERTTTYYETPYGGLYLGVNSKEVLVERSNDRIFVLIDYTLDINGENVSDSKVELEISSKKYFKIES